jgi:flagellum-specific peptidoglycan hydrolase FlgJ
MTIISPPNPRRFLLFICLIAASLAASTMPLTTVSDMVYRADGTPAQGTVMISWGSSGLCASAFNFFGIKARAGRDWVEMKTCECRRGMAVHARARFARYLSMQECFEDRDRMILELPVYAEARGLAPNPEPFLRALARHWATDPHYADKVLQVYHTNHLDLLDSAPAELPLTP